MPADPRPTDLVLAMIAEIPERRATTYGLLGEGVAAVTGRRLPALAVGGVLARSDGALPWWRVVRADGGMVDVKHARAAAHWREEGIPLLRGPQPARVDLDACVWDPVEESRVVARERRRRETGEESDHA